VKNSSRKKKEILSLTKEIEELNTDVNLLKSGMEKKFDNFNTISAEQNKVLAEIEKSNKGIIKDIGGLSKLLINSKTDININALQDVMSNIGDFQDV